MQRRLTVALVSMPFAPLDSPSIGLGLLKAGAIQAGFDAKAFYFSLALARRIGAECYNSIVASPVEVLAGDWIFAGHLRELSEADTRSYVDHVLGAGRPAHSRLVGVTRIERPAFREGLFAAREQTCAFLDEVLCELLAYEPDVVGFTTVFQQTVASLALAQRLKRKHPHLIVIFGGANCTDPMGATLLRAYPFVDAVVSGEADRAFPQLLQVIAEERPFDSVPGVRVASGGHVRGLPQDTYVDLDQCPTPDYSDYFADFARYGDGLKVRTRIPFETSRGCWWGEKHHCIFCGLNGVETAFRRKSAYRARKEISALIEAYGEWDVAVVDNIMDVKSFQDFLPWLATQDWNIRLFFEVKSNLTKHQLRLLRNARAYKIQPGIESLSDRVLALMNKGVRAIHNIQTLKWCKELGIEAGWNILAGFPGEEPREYAAMAALVPSLTHLQPPSGVNPVNLYRYSPLFERAGEFGLENVRPQPAYAHVYGLTPEALAGLAGYFSFACSRERPVGEYTEELGREVEKWMRCHTATVLLAMEKEDSVLLWDTRPCASQLLTVLPGGVGRMYLACDRCTSLDSLAKQADTEKWGLSREQIAAYLGKLVRRRLVVTDGKLYLSLAIPLGEYQPSGLALVSLLMEIRKLGHAEATPAGQVVTIPLAAHALTSETD